MTRHVPVDRKDDERGYIGEGMYESVSMGI